MKHASLSSSIDQGGGKRRGFTRPWAPGLHRRRRIEVAIDEAPAPQPLCRVRSDGDCRKTNSKAREEATHRKPRRCGRRRGRRSGSACRRIFASAACRGNLLGVVVLLDGPRRHGVRDAGGRGAVQASMMACSSGWVTHVRHSSSASRFTAGALGFLTLSQSSDRPNRYGEPRRFDTMPSQPSLQA